MQDGSGYLEVHLHSLANPYGRKQGGSACDWHQGGCDHQFKFCLTVENDDTTCHYGQKSTSTYENTYWVGFGSTISGGLANPFTFAFPSEYPVSSLRSVFSYIRATEECTHIIGRGLMYRAVPCSTPLQG